MRNWDKKEPGTKKNRYRLYQKIEGRKKNMKEHKKSKASGITLIALVVTIIVLLILAGISIMMLSGNNGILNRAGEAKEKNDRMGIIEQARIDILDKIAENKGENITDSQFREVLEKYFTKESIPDEFPEDLSEVKLTSLNERHKILASEIYNGKLKILKPGLYYAGTDNLIMSWEDLIKPSNDMLYVNNGKLTRGTFNIDTQVKLVVDKSVTAIENIPGISQLEEIVIPNSVTSIGDLSWCRNLKELIIPDTVTNINGGALGGCTGLKKLVIGNGVENFPGCPGLAELEEVIMGNKIKEIAGSCFSGCTSLKDVNIPNSVTSIGGNAFRDCKSLTQVIIPDSVTSIQTFVPFSFDNRYGTNVSPFTGCSQLEKLVIGKGMMTIPRDLCFNLVNLESVDIRGNITKIEDHAFNGCKKLSSINIPNTVTSFGVNAFYNCNELEAINIPDGVTSMGSGAFMDCSKLKTITLPGGIKSIDRYTFQRCTSLESITLPDELKSIGEVAFEDCTGLNELRVPSSVDSIGAGAFKNVAHVYYNGPATNFSSWGQKNLN